MSQVTKRALEQSLKNLLLKKPLNKITINDIANDCGINRMTFYYHFILRVEAECCRWLNAERLCCSVRLSKKSPLCCHRTREILWLK